MVGFGVSNLLIFLGQRPDAHYIVMAQNQLSPLVKQDKFPLFEHHSGGFDTEFGRFIQRVLSEKLPFTANFLDAVYSETSGHPYLTVNVLVDFCQWLIEINTPADGISVDARLFDEFVKQRLSHAALQRSPDYTFFQRMLSEYLSELGRRREPWLHAVASVLQRIGTDHPKAFLCPLPKYRQLAEDVAAAAGLTPEQLLVGAIMANFVYNAGGHVSPAIRMIGRLAATVQPEIN